jgi:signal transduction histidine kinase
MELKQVDLATIIKEAFSLTTPMANKFNINLTRPRKADLSCSVTADDTRLKQVLLNLISNAIKYNKPNGEVTIEIKKSEHSPFVLIGVRDTGIGISSQKMSKLFEPFNRLGAENTNIEGVGIGLSITKKIVELMGGHIDVETEEGKGSVFWVEIPVATS